MMHRENLAARVSFGTSYASLRSHAIGNEVFDSPARLTPAILQAAEMLGMYRAELARVLHLQCRDIGRLADRYQTAS